MAKQKDGRYRAKITVGTDASGKSIVKYVSGRTKKELEAAKAAAREKYVTGANAVPEGTISVLPSRLSLVMRIKMCPSLSERA